MALRLQQLGTEDIAGGAARCAYRLHEALRTQGVDSRLLVKRKKSHDDSVEVFRPSTAIPSRLRRKMRRRRIERELDGHEDHRPSGYEPFHGDLSEYGAELLNWIHPETQVVNLHWVARFLDYPSVLPDLVRRVPVVWTLHDMNTFTGGCHYDDGCGRFTEGCGMCPQLDSQDRTDPSSVVWHRKHALFHGLPEGRLHFVTPSQWLGSELRASGILPEHIAISVIPYGLDTEAFHPIDRDVARERLGLPTEKKALLFVAESVDNRRKGFPDLQQALRHLDGTEDLMLLSLGKGEPAVDVDVEHHHLGFVSEDEVLAAAYSASDVFAMPSQEDNLPATVLESLACGTPVAAFDTGGLPDMVRPGHTGALAPLGDHKAFASNLRHLLDTSPGLRRICRNVAETEYPLALQAERYIELYDSLIHSESPAKATKA